MASAASKSDTKLPAKRPIPPAEESSAEVAAMLLPSLYRLTEGLPRKELKVMISEAMICEEALEHEIRQLQEALEESSSDADITASVELMLDSEVTPPDRFFTVSALLGRLRDDLATPLPPNSVLPELRAQAGLTPPPPKKKRKELNTTKPEEPSAASAGATPAPSETSATLEKQKKILALYKDPEYKKEHPQPNALMSLWKKISSHRSSIVFRRPVNPKEAPGYTERISFPMDLSLIRKMIVARQITSYSDLHQRLGMICHNCVKYNGRESDYGVVTRDFESNADEMVLAAVLAAGQETRNPTIPPPTKSVTPPPTTTTAAAAAASVLPSQESSTIQVAKEDEPPTISGPPPTGTTTNTSDKPAEEAVTSSDNKPAMTAEDDKATTTNMTTKGTEEMSAATDTLATNNPTTVPLGEDTK